VFAPCRQRLGKAIAPSDGDRMVRTTQLFRGGNQKYDYRFSTVFICISSYFIPTSCWRARRFRIPRRLVQQQKYCFFRGFVMDWISLFGRYTQLFHLLGICCFGSSPRNSLLRVGTPNENEADFYLRGRDTTNLPFRIDLRERKRR
jgi:hypothetical protein